MSAEGILAVILLVLVIVGVAGGIYTIRDTPDEPSALVGFIVGFVFFDLLALMAGAVIWAVIWSLRQLW
jgi:hypothetical protein